MIGKAKLEGFPKEKVKEDKSLLQVTMKSFSSSVISIKGYVHAVVIVDEYY
jgi:hypothetical protein